MKATLPLGYDNYVFDLYGTLVDIHTEEGDERLWKQLALFFGYYGALYEPEELQKEYFRIVKGKEQELKMTLDTDPHYAHESSPEIEICDVFRELYTQKGVEPEEALVIHTAQLFRVMSTDYVRLYDGVREMLKFLKEQGKNVYLLSNAQRIFTAYELKSLDIFKYFDDVLISSDYKTRKPDARFFDCLIKKYDLDVKKSIYVGNDSKNDVLGAKGVGMNTFYVFSNISPQNDEKNLADYNVEDFESWNY